MPKLTLSLDNLQVDSFATGEAVSAPGTVHGNQIGIGFPNLTYAQTCYYNAGCDGTREGPTCDISCDPNYICHYVTPNYPCDDTQGNCI